MWSTSLQQNLQTGHRLGMNILINVAIYQIAWFLCVLLENSGVLLVLPLFALHFYLSPYKIGDAKLMVAYLVIGCLIDGIIHGLGLIQFNVSAKPIPLWLAMIWLVLATLPNHSLRWLKGRYFLSSFLGFFSGPLAYWGGVKLGAAQFTLSLLPSLTIFGFVWAGLLPLLMYLADRIEPNIKSELKESEEVS